MARRTYGGSSSPVVPDNAGGAMQGGPQKGPSNKVLLALIGGGVLVAILLIAIISSAGGKEEQSAPEETTVTEEVTTVAVTEETAPLYQAGTYDGFNNPSTVEHSSSETVSDDPNNPDGIVVEGEYIYNEDDEAPAETDVTDMVYSEDLDETHTSSPAAPSYESVTKASAANPMDTVLDWTAITTGNKDAVAWIYVPGTAINYPIMQEQKIGEYYYSSHDYYDNKIISGSIFTPKEPEPGIDAHFLVLGHNMKNGSMFHTLMNYTESSFCEKSPYVYIYYPDRTEKWQVWTMFRAYMDDPIYDIPIEKGSASHEALLNSCIKNTMYKTSAKEPTLDEQILTLSTCNNFDGQHKGRFLVNSVLVDTKVYNASANSTTDNNDTSAETNEDTSAETTTASEE